MEQRDSDPVIVPAGEGASLTALGDLLKCKLLGEDTGGTFSLFEAETPSRQGPPLHRHHREDEVCYVLQGDFEFQCGDSHFKASAGAVVFLPRDIPHSYRNLSATKGRMLIISSPSGLETCLEEIQKMPADASADPQKVAKLAKRHGLELLGPPIWQKADKG